MKNVVSITDGELRLCSGLGEYAFGKTQFNTIVTQAGILAKCDSQPDQPLHFSFENWSFEDIKSFEVPDNKERVVFYCAKNPLSEKAFSLQQLFEVCGKEGATKEDKDKMFFASLAVCTILTQAAKEEIDIPLNGGGGIVVDQLDGKIKLLFLPHNLFKYSLAALSPVDQADLHHCWVNPSLQGLPAICFARASFAYKMLTGRFAYSAADSLTRNADILDKKFLPLELSINGINPELAAAVNKGLKLNSNSVIIPGKKPKGKKSEDLVPDQDFPLDLLARAKEDISSKISDSDFEEKVKNYQKLQASRVSTKRTIRRNTSAIIASVIAFFVILFSIRSAYNNFLDDYTTKGLTSTQTIQTFFKGLNNLDIPLLQTFTKGMSARKYVDSISNMYVISKQRQSSGGDLGFLKPAKYFLIATDASKLSKAGLYGVTNIKIDGKSADEYIELQKNREKPASLKEENGVSIQKGDRSLHTVEYYTLHTEGVDSDIYVTKNKATFTLTFNKGRWIITAIENSEQELQLDSNIFKGEFFNRVIANQGDVLKSIKELSLTYDFLPSDKEMAVEKKALDEYLADPYKDLF